LAAVITSARSAAQATPAPQARKLRVGVFADRRVQPRWLVDAFLRIAASEFSEIVVVAAAQGAPASTPLAWQLYERLDRSVFGADPSDGLDLASAFPLGCFKNYPLELEGLDLDVAFALGDFDDTQLDGIARHGVWRFALDGVREVAEGMPVTGSGLHVRLRAGARPRLAYQSWSRTYPLSVARNRDGVLRKSAEFAWRALRELHRNGQGWLEQCRPVEPQAPGAGAVLSGGDIARIGTRMLARGVEKALSVDQWFLAFSFKKKIISGDLQGFTRLMPPKDRYWADPFVLEKNGRHFIFFEDLPFAAGKAHISMIEVTRDGGATPPVKVLERDYHLSYPFLVEQDGELWMIPESGRNRTVEAYRCIDFPLRWRLERVLLDGVRLVDATFHRGADRWWMFANAAAGGSRMFDDELHLFHADRLLGEWKPHPRNPVKSDARCARPAGQLVWRNGALLRPAQICVPRYGAGISMNRVLRLTPHEYAERQVERVLPTPESGLLGIHTVNRAGELTVVDAFARRRRFT
jgi:hypothetical protein